MELLLIFARNSQGTSYLIMNDLKFVYFHDKLSFVLDITCYSMLHCMPSSVFLVKCCIYMANVAMNCAIIMLFLVLSTVPHLYLQSWLIYVKLTKSLPSFWKHLFIAMLKFYYLAHFIIQFMWLWVFYLCIQCVSKFRSHILSGTFIVIKLCACVNKINSV